MKLTKQFCRGLFGVKRVTTWAPLLPFAVWRTISSFPTTPWTSASRGQGGNLGREVVISPSLSTRRSHRFADFRGDSYKLSKEAARAGGKVQLSFAACILWRKADIYPRAGQITFSRLNAGCSMPHELKSLRWKTLGSSSLAPALHRSERR